MFKSGSKPGKGVYVCRICSEKVVLSSNEDVLPDCPVCGAVEYDKESS